MPKANAQAAAAASPNSSSARVDNARHSALADVVKFTNLGNTTVRDLELDVVRLNPCNGECESRLAFDIFVEYLAVRDLQGRGRVKPPGEELGPLVAKKLAETGSGTLSDSLMRIINDLKVWSVCLYIYEASNQHDECHSLQSSALTALH